MDFAYVAFDVGNLRVRAARDRGSIDVSIAPLCSIRNWCSLTEALLALQREPALPKSPATSSLSGAATRLASEFTRLNQAFSEAQFPAIRDVIHDLREARRKAFIEDWNRKSNLYRASQ
jgi:hypothetical protein